MGRYIYPEITPGRKAIVSTHGYWFVKEGDTVVLEGKTEELGLPHHPGMDDIAVDDPNLDGPDDGWEYIRQRLLAHLGAHIDGTPCPRCGGRGQVYYPGDHIVDCEVCTAQIDGGDGV